MDHFHEGAVNMDAGFLSTSLGDLWLAVALVSLLLWVRFRTRRTFLQLLGFGPEARSIRMLVVCIAVCACLGLAVSRPYWGKSESEVSSQGTDIIALVDVSLSMLAEDMPPFRLAFAKRKLLDLVSLLTQRARGDRLGLVLFSGESYLYSPPTADYAILKSYINSISTSLIASGGSSIFEGVTIAISSLESSQALKNAEVSHPLLLLLSDGEDISFNSKQVIAALKKAELRLSAIGIGTVEGRPIELNSGQFIRDRSGQVVLTKLNEENLRTLTDGSGGTYQTATLNDYDLLSILSNEAVSFERSERTQKITNFNEYGPYVVVTILLVMTALFLLGRSNLVFPALLAPLLAVNVGIAHAQSSNEGDSSSVPTRYEAYRAYGSGDYGTALKGFESAVNQDPSDLNSLQALASTLYKLERFEESKGLFNALAEQATSGKQKYEAQFNRGNSELNLKDYKSAIQSYEQALLTKPHDAAALHNLALAKKLLEQEPTPPPPSSQSSSSQDSSHKNSSNQSDSSTQSNSSTSGDDSGSSSSLSSSGESQSDGTGQSNSSTPSDSNGDSGSQATTSSQENNSTGSGDSGSSQGQSGSDGNDQYQSGQASSDAGLSASSPEDSSNAGSQAGPQAYDPKELKEKEARAWLDSLSDSPLLIYKKDRSRKPPGEQYW